MDLKRNCQRDRRLFLKTGVAAATACAIGRPTRADDVSPNERITIGIMGLNGRGSAIMKGMLASGQVDVAYLCDVDERAMQRAAKIASEKQSLTPKMIGDFRQILDDPSVDALICAAPNHWHSPATIMACGAGKHVYVEKPCSHTPAEGELAIAAARKNDRIVQMGNQRRSWPGIIEAIQKVHQGDIGKTLYSRTWYNNRRQSIGIGKQTDPPAWLDWELWQGPAPRRPFKDNVVHYNWHWHWHWGNGELGNNGVHAIDVARWGLQVDYPIQVTAGGGKYRHDDDQETPDTMMVTYDFPNQKSITWEGLSWSPLGPHDSQFGISLHGTEGSIVIRGGGYVQYDMKGQEVAAGSGAAGDQDHFEDFLMGVREHRRTNSDIEGAHKSTLLCHLGNIAYRTSGTLKTNGGNGHLVQNAEAESYWSREYARGWEPKV
ncbi:Gfo/Idh/MocA family protein [Crateriforma spongiae]|uniref:Gfo/Idh/MocA family protein n=1 Tax=Crateriforma spongiae TaxID=2724528 RepID=UPI001447C214|nr:Gfo/Idh/MocA family oxidoreductase [Crateriforma spongiae]